MRILILGGSNSRNSGGLFTAATMLGKSLNKIYNTDVQYLMHNDEYSNIDRQAYAQLPLHNYSVIGSNKIGYSNDILKKIQAINPDIIHSQGIWMYLSYANKKYHAKTGTPYVVSTHGMLDPWQLKQSSLKNFKKKISLLIYEKQHLQNANCIQAVSYEEYVAIREFGLKNPVAIIPNAIELPFDSPDLSIDSGGNKTNGSDSRKTLLFLSRINNKKGLDPLLRAWALTNPENHNWKLEIAGETKDTQYLESLFALCKNLQISNSVKFIGGKFGTEKDISFRNANAFILPSYSEGLPLAVLEAWSYKLPVIMTRFCNIPEGFKNNAAIEIDTTPESIASGIQKVIAMSSDQISKLGNNGFNLIHQKFTWDKVSDSTHKLYKWIVEKTDKPDFVFES